MPGLRGGPFFGVDFYCIFGRFGKMTHLVNFKKCRGSSPGCPGWCGAPVLTGKTVIDDLGYSQHFEHAGERIKSTQPLSSYELTSLAICYSILNICTLSAKMNLRKNASFGSIFNQFKLNKLTTVSYLVLKLSIVKKPIF